MISSATYLRHSALQNELMEFVLSPKVGDIEEFIIRDYLSRRVNELEKELSHIER